MNHNFNVEIAVKYGILEAILFENIAYWVDKNKANNVHFHDGLYWTYNSSKAFAVMFPYTSPRTISRALHHLCDEGLLVTGNYNASPYDRTTWYALTEKGRCLWQNGGFHLPDCQMKVSEMSNGNAENGEPIPDINTDINTNINTMPSEDDIAGGTLAGPGQEEPKRDRLEYDRVKSDFNSICRDLPEVKAMSDARKRAVRLLLNELERLKLMPGLSPYEALRRLFQTVQDSSFLSGRDGKWGKCSFDWIINKKNALKILEGNYADKGGGGGNGRNNGKSGGFGNGAFESTTAEAIEVFRRNRGNAGVPMPEVP